MKYTTRYRVFGGLMVLSGLFPGILGIISLISVPFVGLKALPYAVLYLGPIFGLWFARRWRDGLADRAERADFEAFIASRINAKPNLIWYERSSGVAVGGGLIFLAADGVNKAYTPADFRRWYISFEDAKTVAPVGTRDAFQHYGSNMTKLMDAWLAAGIYVEVKDIEHPVWQLRFKKEGLNEARRWVEILNQAVNGAPAQPASHMAGLPQAS